MAGIVIAIAIGLYSLSEGWAYKSAAARAAESRHVVDWTQGLLSLLKDAETSEHGYLLTGDPRYLAPYNAALPGIAAERARAASLNPVDPEGSRRLSDLVGASPVSSPRCARSSGR